MIKKTKILTLLQTTAIGLFLAMANFAYALETTYPTIFGLSLGDEPTLPEYAKYFFNIGILSAGILAILVIAFGGVYYLIDYGRGKFKTEGTEWIKAGVLGLLLIMCAYLIVYTINPYLVIFDLKGLAPLTFFSNIFNSPAPSLPIDIYTEIPIGTLTENLLTRAMDCYNFDENGDPVEGEIITADDGRKLYGPTYLEHDRADCFLKLAEAVEKKSNIANELSKKIAELMQQCSCSQGQSTCWSRGNYDEIKIDKIGQNKCKPELEQSDCDPGIIGQSFCENIQGGVTFQGGSGENCDLCSENVIKVREKGPIKLGEGEKSYEGLDEFRSKFNNDYFAIKTFVEVQPPVQMDGKEIWVINNGNCQVCQYQCPNNCEPGDRDCINEKQKCEGERTKCQNDRKQCLQKNSPWYKLRLIDQLIYLRGKAEEIKQGVQQDIDNLKNAESDLGRCYLADAYVDFLKTYEQTNKKDKIILIEQTFSDPETQQIVNPAKYCEGFQYNNSSCYSQCQKVCPGTSQKEIDCYKKEGPDCTNKTGQERIACLDQQALNIKKCYDNRSCIPDASPFGTFSECMTGCRQQCVNSCVQNSLSEEEAKECQENCNSDSQCLLDNESVCLVNFNRVKNCSDPASCITACKGDNECISKCQQQYNDVNFIKNCVENSASLCTYCSDQYAGYPECVKPSYYKGDYSSSFMCAEPNSQVCAYGITTKDVNGNVISQTTSACISQNPETSKCPTGSKCPECPCDIVTDEPIESSSYSSSGESEATGTNCSDTQKNNGKDAAYRVCSPTCDSYAFNDDPLTFYCNQTWWKKDETKNTEPLGSSKVCPKKNEIPVGRTVDDAEAWGQALLQVINNFTQKADDFVGYIKKIGKEKDYCKANSQCGNGETACYSGCVYVEGNEDWPDDCMAPASCSGNPCQKMVNMLIGKEDGNKSTGNKPDSCTKGTDKGLEGVEWYLEQVRDGLKEVKDFVLKDKRSDILKELEYSRQGINTCSTNYEKETSILSCTRVEDEIMPPLIATSDSLDTIVGTNKPVASYCYGQALGEILSTEDSLADNWFCCQTK